MNKQDEFNYRVRCPYDAMGDFTMLIDKDESDKMSEEKSSEENRR